MSEYVDVGGIHTWYDERGKGEPLVLLHPGGAGVDARAWGPQLPGLADRFRVFTPERRAHGRTPDVDGPVTFELMADETIAFLETVVDEPAHLMGSSDGAIVALLVALHSPDLIRKLVFIAGVFHRDGWEPGVVDPDNNPPEFLERLYGELSPDGPEHYPVVVAKLAKMHVEGPTLNAGDLNRIGSRTLVCNTVIIDFLTADPVATWHRSAEPDKTSAHGDTSCSSRGTYISRATPAHLPRTDATALIPRSAFSSSPEDALPRAPRPASYTDSRAGPERSAKVVPAFVAVALSTSRVSQHTISREGTHGNWNR